MRAWLFSVVVVAFLGSPTDAAAEPELRGWVKLLGAGLQFPDLPPSIAPGEDSDSGALTTANIRVEASAVPLPNLRLDLALIGHAQWTDFPASFEALGASIPGAGSGTAAPGRLFDATLDGTSGDRSFVGDVDRLSLTFWLGNLEIVMGRQAISWGRTMVFQPLDVLGPFSLLSFDTEAKPGIDALRIRVPVFADGTLDLVANQDAMGENSAYAARITMIGGLAELGITGGRIRDEWMAGLDGVWSFEKWSLRWESLYLPDRGGLEGLVATVGFDRFFLNGDLQIFLELLHDSRGASEKDELLEVFSSGAFVQGRMKVPCQNAGALGLRQQLDPLWTLSLSIVADLQNPSGLGFLQVTRSLSDNVSMDLIVYKAVGESLELDPSVGLRPGSSFGSFPSMAAVYLRIYQ